MKIDNKDISRCKNYSVFFIDSLISNNVCSQAYKFSLNNENDIISSFRDYKKKV